MAVVAFVRMRAQLECRPKLTRSQALPKLMETMDPEDLKKLQGAFCLQTSTPTRALTQGTEQSAGGMTGMLTQALEGPTPKPKPKPKPAPAISG